MSVTVYYKQTAITVERTKSYCLPVRDPIHTIHVANNTVVRTDFMYRKRIRTYIESGYTSNDPYPRPMMTELSYYKTRMDRVTEAAWDKPSVTRETVTYRTPELTFTFTPFKNSAQTDHVVRDTDDMSRLNIFIDITLLGTNALFVVINCQ